MLNPLILRAQDRDGGYVEIGISPFTVGRGPLSDLRIRHPGISGLHALFRDSGGTWRVEDQGSTNGTFVNGVRIHDSMVVNLGDVVHFGGIGFRVVPSAELSDIAGSTRTLPDSAGRVRSVLEVYRITHENQSWAAFQPIEDLSNRRVVGFEALGRAASPDSPGPDLLFRTAEETDGARGLSQAFRRSAMACAACRHCWPSDRRRWLFLNVHPSEILSPTFPSLLADLGQSDLMRWYRLVVELPESLVLNARELLTWVEQIRKRGLLVAYDDFGRGQSRIPDLLHAPPDFLKLDRELVADLGTRRVKDDLVKAVVDACGRLGVRTVAEGIEDDRELAACKKLGIRYGQGYGLARPQPAWKLFGVDTHTLPAQCPFVRLGILREPSTAVPAEKLT